MKCKNCNGGIHYNNKSECWYHTDGLMIQCDYNYGTVSTFIAEPEYETNNNFMEMLKAL